MVEENNNLKLAIQNFQEKKELKNKEITRLKVTMDDLKRWNFDLRDEIKRKDNDLSQVKFVLELKKIKLVNTKK